MYSLPSASQMCPPSPRWMKSGCPPTARNARTGELTPPGITDSARLNSCSDFDIVKSRGLQELGQLHCVIGNQNIRACALDRRNGFHDDALPVDPAGARSGFNHGVFSADLIRSQRQIELLTGTADDVEIRKSRFYHHDIGAFFDIERDLPQRFPHIRRI